MHTNISEKKLINMYRERNPDAIRFTQLKYGNILKEIAFNILESEQDAEECVNDTLLKAWNSIPDTVPENMMAYLARICRNIALNVVERNNTQKRYANYIELSYELSETLCQMPDDDSLDNYLVERIEKYLLKQKKEKRVMFVLRYWYGESIAEISDSMGVSEGKIKMVLHRMKEDLRLYLSRDDET